MNKMVDFKCIADDVMCDVAVSDELKRKTMSQLSRSKNSYIIKVLVPAACFLLIIGIMNIRGILPPESPSTDPNSQMNIMSGTVEGAETLPGQSDNTIGLKADTIKKWQINNVEEAKSSFTGAFLTPSYMPQGYGLENINASGYVEKNASKIVLNYFAGEKSYMVIEEESEVTLGFNNFKAADINGTSGYIKTGIPSDGSNINVPDTELHWFKDGVHYTVAGLITDVEAMKVAESMK